MRIAKALIAKVEAVPSNKPRVPFGQFGCVLHKTHKPRPNRVELHHRFAVYLQAQVWDDVIPGQPGTAHDKERIPVCEGGHSDIHIAVNAIFALAPMPKGIGHAERAEAEEMIARFNAAKAAKPSA